jgi:hypothetical protein
MATESLLRTKGCPCSRAHNNDTGGAKFKGTLTRIGVTFSLISSTSRRKLFVIYVVTSPAPLTFENTVHY